MNTGQTMLVIAAFALLSTLTLAVNATMVNTSTLGWETEASLNALSIAQSMLDEILTRDYDQNTITQRIFQPSQLTASGSLGAEGSEAITGVDSSSTGNFLSKVKFNDVDDYHLYHRRAYDPRMGWFDVVDTVQYVQDLNPDQVTTTQTWHKRISVNVNHFALPKDLNGNVIPFELRDCSVYRKYF